MKRKRISVFSYLIFFSLFLLSANVSTANCVVAGEMRVVPQDAPFVVFHTNPPGTPGYNDYVVSFNPDGSMSFDFSRGFDGKSYGFQPNSRYEWEALFFIENLEGKPVTYKIISQGLKYICVEDGTSGNTFILNGENQDNWAAINSNQTTSIKVAFAIPEDAPLGNISGTLSIVFDREATLPQVNDTDDSDDNDDSDEEILSLKVSTPILDDVLIGRMQESISLSEALKINQAHKELIFVYDSELLKTYPSHEPRVYYWNEKVNKWIALASYQVSKGRVKTINNEGYTGWFKVFGVVQPQFTDIEDHWAEITANRMNGLGIIEGHGDSVLRPVRLDEPITRAEFITLLYRLLNINPDQLWLEVYTQEQAKDILLEYFQDADEIPDGMACTVASAAKANLIVSREGRLAENEPIIRLEADIMVSNALKLLEQHQAMDISQLKDAEDITDWFTGTLAENADDFITRAEAITLLNHLFINGMGL